MGIASVGTWLESALVFWVQITREGDWDRVLFKWFDSRQN